MKHARPDVRAPSLHLGIDIHTTMCVCIMLCISMYKYFLQWRCCSSPACVPAWSQLGQRKGPGYLAAVVSKAVFWKTSIKVQGVRWTGARLVLVWVRNPLGMYGTPNPHKSSFSAVVGTTRPVAYVLDGGTWWCRTVCPALKHTIAASVLLKCNLCHWTVERTTCCFSRPVGIFRICSNNFLRALSPFTIHTETLS